MMTSRGNIEILFSLLLFISRCQPVSTNNDSYHFCAVFLGPSRRSGSCPLGFLQFYQVLFLICNCFILVCIFSPLPLLASFMDDSLFPVIFLKVFIFVTRISSLLAVSVLLTAA